MTAALTPPRVCLLAGVAAALLSGCSGEKEVTAYALEQSDAPRPFRCRIPNGWGVAPNDRFSVLAFEAGNGTEGNVARITVSSLDGDSPEMLLPNIDRWRRQVGLPPTTQEQLDEDLKTISLGGRDSRYVELTGAARALRGAIVGFEGKSWFFKISGPPPLVMQEAERFQEFLDSISFRPERSG